MEAIRGGVTAPAGFSASGVFCGIKKRGKDLALLVSDRPATVVGMLTLNTMRAYSVEWAANILRRGKARAIVANSGNANCCTGRKGEKNTREMAQRVAQALGVPRNQILVGSTGVIGRSLPMDKVRTGILDAVRSLSRHGSASAAEAILTTDMHSKEFAVRFQADGVPVTIGGIAKGSGMISPHMATMFAFLTTDARVERTLLKRILLKAVDLTFNRITVDGEMSTNDMVLLLANGAAENAPIRSKKAEGDLLKGIATVCHQLATEIVRDGEGVTRTMFVKVTGARAQEDARQIARQIANSALVKTMVAGRDPNWGRVAAAVGASGVPIDPRRVTIGFGGITVYRRGEPVRARQKALLEEADRPEVTLWVDLGAGDEEYYMHGGDLTEGYIRINAKYTT